MTCLLVSESATILQLLFILVPEILTNEPDVQIVELVLKASLRECG
jgi:hypothetical protein